LPSAWSSGLPLTREIRSLPATKLQSFVADSGFDDTIYGDEGAGASPPVSGFATAMRASLAAAEPTGKRAVMRSKAVDSYKSTTVAVDSEAKQTAGLKSVEGKTFYLTDGIWTDSSFDPDKSAKPEQITFGSKEYFDLISNVPGISKYLAIGRQVIL